MVVIELQELHFVVTFRTTQRVVTEGEENRGPPPGKTAVYLALFFRNDMMQF